MRLPDLMTNRSGRLPRFLLAGGFATLLHWLIMLVLIRFGVGAVSATSIGAPMGLLANYALQHRYLTGAGLGWGLNLLSFSLLMAAGTTVALSQLVATGLVAFANYLFAKRFVFHEKTTINLH